MTRKNLLLTLLSLSLTVANSLTAAKPFVTAEIATGNTAFLTDSDATDRLTDSIAAAPVQAVDSISPDSIAAIDSAAMLTHAGRIDPRKSYRFRPLQLIIPATLIGVGFIGLESDWLKGQNSETRDELQEHPHPQLTLDDFTQFAPIAATYGLKLCGVKSLHDYIDMTIIASTAYLLTGISVYGIKTLTKVERPDGSARNSFPSGHTATAFAGAEILRREYWDTSPWIGVAGYVVAAGTGFFRMYNNRHWLTDVIAGAGIGILSAEAAYWLYPYITKAIFKKRYSRIFAAPKIDSTGIGLTAEITF